MPRIYWAEAIQTTVYIQNRISALGTKVWSHELYFEQKPNLAHLWVLSKIAYVHVPYEKWKKLDAKSKKCILLGYFDEQKGYKCHLRRNNIWVPQITRTRADYFGCVAETE